MKSFHGWDDHRRDVTQRVELTLPVLIQPLDAFSVVRGRSVNLSVGGIFVESEERFQAGEEVGVTVDLRDGAEPVGLHAEVAWVRPASRAQLHLGVALRFTRLVTPSDELRIRNALAQGSIAAGSPDADDLAAGWVALLQRS